jgi:nitrile hydratase
MAAIPAAPNGSFAYTGRVADEGLMSNTIHDLGGMQGFGPIIREEHEPVWHEPWEGRSWGIRQSVIRGGHMKLRPGENRAIIEDMGAVAYLTTSYYARFLYSTVDRIIAHGLLSSEELDQRTAEYLANPALPVPERRDPVAAAAVRASLMVAPRPKPPAGEPTFHPGQVVVARNLNWEGHNRLPRYVRGRRGTIARVNGWYEIEDDHADRLGRDPQPVYTVGFDGAELWGPDAEPNLRVYLELWEGYLAPAAPESDRGSIPLGPAGVAGEGPR